MKRWLACALLLAGCDHSYSTHLRVHVTRAGRPLAGAQILSLVGGEAVARTNEWGIAEAELRAFNQSAAGYGVVIALRLDQLMVLMPEQDYPLTPRGLLVHRGWDAQVEAEFVALAPSLSLRCEEKSCSVSVPEASCALHEVALGEATAKTHFLNADGQEHEGAVLRARFARVFTGPAMVVAVCRAGATWQAYLSNLIR